MHGCAVAPAAQSGSPICAAGSGSGAPSASARARTRGGVTMLPGATRILEIVSTPIPLERLTDMARASFGGLVTAVVDVDRGIMAIDAEMHSDINVRPSKGNRSRTVDDEGTRLRIRAVVDSLIES